MATNWKLLKTQLIRKLIVIEKQLNSNSIQTEFDIFCE